MNERAEVLKRFVLAYDIEVPAETVENELQAIKLDLRHRRHYEALSSGDFLPYLSYLSDDLDKQEDELRELAFYEVKSELVIKEVIAELGFDASPEELEREAESIAKREQSTMELVRRFFGEDLAGLRDAVRRNKAIDWICAQGASA